MDLADIDLADTDLGTDRGEDFAITPIIENAAPTLLLMERRPETAAGANSGKFQVRIQLPLRKRSSSWTAANLGIEICAD